MVQDSLTRPIAERQPGGSWWLNPRFGSLVTIVQGSSSGPPGSWPPVSWCAIVALATWYCSGAAAQDRKCSDPRRGVSWPRAASRVLLAFRGRLKANDYVMHKTFCGDALFVHSGSVVQRTRHLSPVESAGESRQLYANPPSLHRETQTKERFMDLERPTRSDACEVPRRSARLPVQARQRRPGARRLQRRAPDPLV